MNRKFNRPVQIRLTDQDYEELHRQVAAKGIELGVDPYDVSKYVRWLINHHNPDRLKGGGER